VRLAGGVFFLSLALYSQEPAPIGIVRGTLLEYEGTAAAGELSIRAAGNRVHRFSFDGKTYFEREKQRIPSAALRKGDLLEIVADRLPDSALRYARTVHVREPERPAAARLSAGRFRSYRSASERLRASERLLPRGNLTFAGLVARLNEQRIVLRTRADGEKVIFLRPDTRYLEDGSQVAPAALKANTRVFIRAGHNLDNEIEAYQVVWGEILPAPARQ
jgi:hypothetical protein